VAAEIWRTQLGSWGNCQKLWRCFIRKRVFAWVTGQNEKRKCRDCKIHGDRCLMEGKLMEESMGEWKTWDDWKERWDY